MKTIDFLKYRYIFLIFSFVIIVSGLTYGFMTKFKFDLDFKGGTNIQFNVNAEFDNTEIETLVKDVTGVSPLIQKVSGGNNAVSITSENLSNDTIDNLVAKLKEKYPQMGEASIKNVQPSYGKEIVNSGIYAVVLAVILLLIYIGFRFRLLGFTAAVTSIIALLHDVLILVAFYGVFKFPINSSFIAVILTIFGYSINDTIIVYDRIRENKRKVTKTDNLKNVINDSIYQTLPRTVNTLLTTTLAILCVYLFSAFTNQTVLKEFSLPLVVGMITGTYSSVFVASSLWYMAENAINKYKKGNGKVKVK